MEEAQLLYLKTDVDVISKNARICEYLKHVSPAHHILLFWTINNLFYMINVICVFCQSFASGVEESEGFIYSISVIFILIPSS